MASTQWQGQLDRFKGVVKEFWGELTGDQRAFSEGMKERMVGRLEAKYGLDRKEAEREAEDWLSRM